MPRSKSQTVAALTRDVTFRDVRLIEVQAKQSVRIGPLPTATQIKAMIQAQKIEREQEQLLRFLPVLTLESRYEDDATRDGILIMARYQITYGATSLRHATNETLTEFAAKEAMPIVWPYWQAFVADLLGRMGLPFLRIEPFNQATLVRGEPPLELQMLGIPTTPKRKHLRGKR